MRTIERAHAILSSAPAEAARDAAGLVLMGAMIFAGFLVPGLL